MDMETAARSRSFDSGLREPSENNVVMRSQLLSAVEDLSSRGLKLSAKWAAEQLVGLAEETPPSCDEREAEAFSASARGSSSRYPPRSLRRSNEDDDDAINEGVGEESADPWLRARAAFAKTLMDVGEFERASQVFEDRLSPARDTGDQGGSLLGRARFLRWYSLFLAGERRREEESQLTDALQKRRAANPHLPVLYAELSAFDEDGKLDAFGLFIYGAVLKALRKEGRQKGGGNQADFPGSRTPSRTETTPTTWKGTGGKSPSISRHSTVTTAEDVLCRSLQLCPCNWSAWLDLATLCLETDTVPEGLENNPCPWMHQFFLQHLLVEQHRSKEALTVLDELHELFPSSSYVLAQTAIAHYHMRDFNQGHADFKELQRRDPFRMEGLDVFSNILYVKECKAELSHLAHSTVKSAPLRPETSCIIGNYYSLKRHHEKAVTYFLRALKLDRRCLSAWTLMGHEFVEMKNSGAAIESYRQAVDINAKDYRAWYGLGQAYEILQMHLYAIYYYKRATALRPYDARMWIAMGDCLEKLGKPTQAINTYERAMANDDREGLALDKLAKLYAADGQREAAAKCYETMLQQKDRDKTSAEEGMLFLCHYYKDKGDYINTSRMAHGLLDYTGTSREEAMAVLRELRSIMDTRQAQEAQALVHSEEGARSLFTPDHQRAVNSSSNFDAGRYGQPTSSRARGQGAGTPRGANASGNHSNMTSPSMDASVAMSLGSDSAEEGSRVESLAGDEAFDASSSHNRGQAIGDSSREDDSFGDMLSP